MRVSNVVIVLSLCVLQMSLVCAGDRSPQGVAEGVEKPLRLSPQTGNGRNSEGDFIALKDGRLMLVYTKFVGTSDHATAELVARFSTDEGQTWSADDKAVIALKPGEANLMSVSLLRLQDGRIAMFYVQKYANTSGKGYGMLDYIFVRFSADEAETWGNPVHISPKDDPGYRVLNNDRVVQLKSGRLVVPVAVHYVPGDSGWSNTARVHCYLSDDAGQTWRSGKTTLSTELLAQEPGVVELADGRLLMFCRSQDCQLVSHSDDGGDTWNPLKKSDILQPTASPASIERIPSTGDLLMLWNNGADPRAKKKPVGRRPFTAAISNDDGVTWKHVKNVGTDPDGWYCYTAIDFVGDHVVLGHCEYPKLNSLQITRIPVGWFYAAP